MSANTWLDGKQFIVSVDIFDAFKHIKKPFGCKLCGHKFQVSDSARWIYANGTKGIGTGNFFVCKTCDGEQSDVLSRAKNSYETAVKLAKQWDIYGPDWEQDRR